MNTSKINKVLNLLIKLAILIVAYLFLYYQIIAKNSFRQTWDFICQGIQIKTFILSLIVLLIMMLLNWSLEAFKWRYLIRKTEQISFFTAFRAVWAGITVSTFTPNRVGEFFGRVFLLKKTNPWQGAFMTVVGSFSQLLITLVIGSVAAFWFVFSFVDFKEYIPEFLFWVLCIAAILIDIILIVLYFNVKLFEPILRRLTLKRWTKLREHLKVFAAYTKKELLLVLLFSLGRYIIFVLQFYFLMWLFLVPIPFFDGIMIISCIYFLMAAIPTVALTELGVRGSLALILMEMYYANNYLISDTAGLGAVTAATLIWLINLVIPTLIGGFFVLQLRFFRK
jgi:uncharacterized membrane protein YbhN (UPF0104 family)